MFLKRIELIGFKSFASKVVIDLAPGVTAVVGPNGSGKSNLGDALRWVLGETTARPLRATRAEELIFAGSATRKAQGMCEVTVTLDNSHGELPIAFNEISITRRAFRTGQGEYLLNGTPCRLKDIQDLLAGTGLSQGGYALVGQGEIDALLAARPDERRAYFEEAAGIMRYRRRQAEALDRLQHTEQSLTRLRDILAELQAQMDPVREQAERAALFLERQRELDTLQLAVYEHDLRRLQASSAAVRSELQELAAEIAAVERAGEDLTERLGSAGTQVEELEREIASWRRALSSARQESERAAGDVRLGRERLDRATSDLARYREEERTLKDRQQGLAASEAELSARHASSAAELTDLQQEIATLSAQIDGEQAALVRARTVLEEENRQVLALGQRLAARRQALAAVDQEGEAAGRRLEAVERDLERALARQAALQEERQREQAETEAVRRRQEELHAAVTALEHEVQTGQAALEEMKAKVSAMRQELAKLASRRQALAELGLAPRPEQAGARMLAEQARLTRPEVPGVLGLLAELIDVEEAGRPQAEVMLGDLAYLAVVEDAAARERAREFVSAHGAGPVTIVALSEVPPAPAWRPPSAGWQPLAAQVRYPPALERVVQWLLGPAMVARPDWTPARDAQPAGHASSGVVLFYPDGHMVTAWAAHRWPGGAARGKGPLAVAAEIRDLQVRIAELERSIAAGEQSARDTAAGLEERRAALRDVQAKAGEAGRALARIESAVAATDRELAQVNAQIARLGQDRAALLKGGEERQSRRLALENEVDALQEEYSAHQGRLGPAEQAWSERQAALQSLSQRMAALREKRAALEAQVRHEQEQVERLRQEQAAVARRLAELGRLMEAADRQMAEQAAQLQAATARAERARVEEKKAQDMLAELAARQRALNEYKAGLLSEQDAYRRQSGELNARRHRLETQLARMEAEEESLVRALEERYPQVKEELLARVRAAKSGDVQTFDRQRAMSRLHSLREEIAGLGSVNVGAIEEMRRLEERHRFLSGQMADMEQSRRDLLDLVAEVQKALTTQFTENFRRIQAAFADLFQEAFGGGQGTVALTNPDDPLQSGIDISVQPPGKRINSMVALSGGERAMVGIVLLFAFLKVNPSPFCLLDEVDSSLDESNVQRFLRLVSQYRRKSQFLIITHNRTTMEAADILHGVVMDTDGASRTISVRLAAAETAGADAGTDLVRG